LWTFPHASTGQQCSVARFAQADADQHDQHRQGTLHYLSLSERKGQPELVS